MWEITPRWHVNAEAFNLRSTSADVQRQIECSLIQTLNACFITKYLSCCYMTSRLSHIRIDTFSKWQCFDEIIFQGSSLYSHSLSIRWYYSLKEQLLWPLDFWCQTVTTVPSQCYLHSFIINKHYTANVYMHILCTMTVSLSRSHSDLASLKISQANFSYLSPPFASGTFDVLCLLFSICIYHQSYTVPDCTKAVVYNL